MTFKSIIAAFAFLASSTLAYAACSGHGDKTASSCMDGYIWSVDTQSCVEQKTS